MERVTSSIARCSILHVGARASTGGWRGIIRKSDVRAAVSEKLRMGDCFRAGDVVCARVLAPADSEHRCLLLSTAENQLGVLLATSAAGGTSAGNFLLCSRFQLKSRSPWARP